MNISALNIYPLKSARGISVPQIDCLPSGLAGDRRAIICEPDGRFITQREEPDLARIIAGTNGVALTLSMNGLDPIIAAPDHGRSRFDAKVWKDTVSAAAATKDVDDVLSDWLKRPVRLGFFDDQSQRIASRDWVSQDTPVGFADGFQLLVTTTGSLDALNENLRANDAPTIEMDRFRPNIVIDCKEPWAEDLWAEITIGSLRLEFVKPCARCIITTQDQLTGSREGATPMPAMARLRMSGDRRAPGPLFGWNAVPHGEAMLHVGDVVTITKKRDTRWPIRTRA